MQPLSDQQIVIGCNRRDPRALEWIVQEYRAKALLFAGLLTDNPDESADLVSDAFAELMIRTGSFERVSQIRQFLFAATRNICLDHLKHKQVVEDKAGDLAYHYHLLHEDRTDEAETIAACRARIRELAGELPPKLRQVFRLYFFEEFSNSEIASRLNVSEKTVANQKTKAIKFIVSQIRKTGGRNSLSLLLFLLP